MTDDMHSLAREIEALDETIADANADKAEVFRRAKKVLREDLPAFREALAQRRKRDKNPAAYQELKGRAAELLDALDNGVVIGHARAPARGPNRTDRAVNDARAPEGPAEGEKPPRPDPITESSEGAASSPQSAAVGGLSPPTPSLDPESGPGSAQQPATTNATAKRQGRDSAGNTSEDFDPVRDLPPWCDHRRKSPENDAIRGRG